MKHVLEKRQCNHRAEEHAKSSKDWIPMTQATTATHHRSRAPGSINLIPGAGSANASHIDPESLVTVLALWAADGGARGIMYSCPPRSSSDFVANDQSGDAVVKFPLGVDFGFDGCRSIS